MTNHIEKLMKAAGVSKYRHFRQYNYAQVPHGEKELQKSIDAGIECVDVRNCKDNDCIYWNELHYPKFTPAKQLELIKLIGQQSGFQIHQNEGMDWLLSDSIYADLSFNTQGYSYSSFENALCKLTINLLKKKALNKSEVKRILEDDN